MKRSKVLSAASIDRLSKPGMYRDSDGLYLKVGCDKDGKVSGKSWVFRYMLAGAAHNMGLGPYPEISLADARKLASEYRADMKRLKPLDPLAERKKNLAAMRAGNEQTFARAAESWFAHHAKKVSADHAADVKRLVERACKPIWHMPARDVDKTAVKGVLAPWFPTKAVTGQRLANWIASIIEHASFLGWRPDGSNPAQWAGNLDQGFVARRSHDIRHHPALPYVDAPAFAAELRHCGDTSARALEFLCLTAVRSGNVRLAKWDQIDLERRVWNIPQTKNYTALDVHLSDRVVEILQALPRLDGNPYVFAGIKPSKPIGEKQINGVMRKLRPGLVTHGLRSTFKDWATSWHFKWEAIEMTLAHKVGSAVERAYTRDNLPAERRRILDAWADYLSRPLIGGDVVPLARKARNPA